MPHDSYSRLEETIRDFVTGKSPGAMLLRGKWGVGKTHACLSALKARRKVNQQAFSYVSLYGISSIEQVYTRVALGWINKVTDKLPDCMEGIVEQGGAILKLASAFTGKAEKISAIGSATVGIMARNMIVVIDDLERRDEALSVKAALGVVSYLVESRDCRVIFIANDDELKGEDKIAFENQKEKVFDIETHYSPSVDENVTIFGGQNIDLLLPPLKGLNERNLRVIRRVSDRLDFLRKKLTDDYPISKAALLKNAAVLGILYYGYRTTADLANRKTASYIQVMEVMESVNEQLTDSDRLFGSAGFEECPADSEIVEFFQTGVTDWGLINKKLEDGEKEAQNAQYSAVMSDIISKFYDNFIATRDEIVEGLIQNCEANTELISPSLLASAGKILSRLGHPGFEKKWLDRWEKANIKGLSNERIREILSVRQSFPFSLVPEVKKEAERRAEKVSLQRDLFTFFSTRAWSSEKIQKLAELPLAVYSEWLEKTDEKSVGYIVQQVFRNFAGQPAPDGIIAQKTLKAVNALSRVSLINKLRANGYKASLPNLPNICKPRAEK